jgi:hypothetical protein
MWHNWPCKKKPSSLISFGRDLLLINFHAVLVTLGSLNGSDEEKAGGGQGEYVLEFESVTT